MVFTQYTDTMEFLRDELHRSGESGILDKAARSAPPTACRTVSREEVKRPFREAAAELLLCTDATAEGRNSQFCGALVNYDMPWNPMRVEQRIGRIDRLGIRSRSSAS